jgi:hypothetical protein
MIRALCAMMLVGGVAVAEGRVIEPSIARMCPGGKTWTIVAQCLGRHGKARVLKSQGSVKLVKLARSDDSGWRIPGFYLYSQVSGVWRLTGMLQGDEWDFVSFQKVTIRRFNGWRIDVKRVESNTQLSGEGTSTVLRQSMSVFCGPSMPCSLAITSCDFYIGGKAHWTFRGRLENGEGVVYVRGDRSKSGGECEQEEEVFLAEPPEPLFE